ncbi:MAG: hypothetical protein OXG81_09555 [Acidobacteria bacterium]|nr:hypothetical protein [Acidobacteriota bacterium]
MNQRTDKSLAGCFAEFRAICTAHHYELKAPERRNRGNEFASMLHSETACRKPGKRPHPR